MSHHGSPHHGSPHHGSPIWLIMHTPHPSNNSETEWDIIWPDRDPIILYHRTMPLLTWLTDRWCIRAWHKVLLKICLIQWSCLKCHRRSCKGCNRMAKVEIISRIMEILPLYLQNHQRAFRILRFVMWPTECGVKVASVELVENSGIKNRILVIWSHNSELIDYEWTRITSEYFDMIWKYQTQVNSAKAVKRNKLLYSALYYLIIMRDMTVLKTSEQRKSRESR